MADIKGSQADIVKIRQMEKDRQDKLKEIEDRKKKIINDSVGLTSIDEKFQANSGYFENQFKQSTVGLVSAEDYKKKRLEMEALKTADKEKEVKLSHHVKQKQALERKKDLSVLSFQVDEEEEFVLPKKKKAVTAATGSGDVSGSVEVALKSGKVTKDPTIDTSFLPDKQREQQEQALRAELEGKWLAEQDALKKEKIEVVFSYWDGSGHRNSLVIEKGSSIEEFLEQCRQKLCDSFSELRSIGCDGLMYVKEDIIIPLHYTFYDLIVTKARGKSGPLFCFDVHEDVRLKADARIEKDESHAGKVITRSWYERNKHIFPATRWEIYDPKKAYDKYTVA